MCRKLWDAITSSVNRVLTGILIFTISAVKGNADFFHIPVQKSDVNLPVLTNHWSLSLSLSLSKGTYQFLLPKRVD